MRAAVDIGGTFTDIIVYNEDTGESWTGKILSTLKQPANSFMDGLLQVLREANTKIEELDEIVHGTTIATNALLEGKTAKIGLLVTEGFRDLLEIGRQQRPSLYDLMVDRHPPLVPRYLVEEIRERIGADGKVVIPLDENDAQTKIEMLNKAGVEALAVTLLFSFFNPEHEKKIGVLTQKLMPHKFVFLSSQVLPEFREFERASTTVVAAAIAPLVVSYLQAIRQKLKAHNWDRDWFAIMHSGGGILWPKEVIRRPHTLIESGPAAGLVASGQLAKILGFKKVIGFDMGGTTAKTGLILDGKPQYAAEYEVGGEFHHGGRVKGSGYPIRFPMIDVAECGAGAGSIAWIDSGGHLKVGPHSAAADPGPACYGKGGKKPTVTDAHLVLGHISSDYFLGGEMLLKPKLAQKAIIEHIAEPMNITLEKAAQGIITIANANMLRILRLVSVARGYDPRDFTLMAYGGAGPLHATDLAEEMLINRVVIPLLPGLFSALGLLHADMSTDFVETVMLTLTPDNLDSLNEVLASL
ncbi:MAG: hydantoinase/oxoprolinase family protein, partial [Candidatus Hodarchaeota archaeon]